MCMFGLIQKQHAWSEGVCNVYVWSDSETVHSVRRSV